MNPDLEIKQTFVEAILKAEHPTEAECRIASAKGKLIADICRLFQTRKDLDRVSLDREVAQRVDVAFAEIDRILGRGRGDTAI